MTTATTTLAAEFRSAFRHHPSGVALLTASTGHGPVGLTASSVTSVAVDPAALSFSVMQQTRSAGGLLAADTILVHLLDARHADLAHEFAVSGGRRFTSDQGWTTLPTGEPLLPDVRAAPRCRPTDLVPVGQSTLVVAQVLEIRHGRTGSAMAYHDGTFHHAAAPL